jgi:hypothetical protein
MFVTSTVILKCALPAGRAGRVTDSQKYKFKRPLGVCIVAVTTALDHRIKGPGLKGLGSVN